MCQQKGDTVWIPNRKKGHIKGRIIEIKSDEHGKYALIELEGISGLFAYDLEELVKVGKNLSGKKDQTDQSNIEDSVRL